MYVTEACLGCGLCENTCNLGAISIIEDKAEINHQICVNCGMCIDICPVNAIKAEEKFSNRYALPNRSPVEEGNTNRKSYRNTNFNADPGTSNCFGHRKFKHRREQSGKSGVGRAHHMKNSGIKNTRENLLDYKYYLEEELRRIQNKLNRT